MPETTTPIQEDIRFPIIYGNVYVDTTTQQLEIGARVYRTPGAADERRRTHPCRAGLAHVGVYPLSAVVPMQQVLSAIQLTRVPPDVSQATGMVEDAPVNDDDTPEG